MIKNAVLKRTTLICFLYLLLSSCHNYSSKIETALTAAGNNRKELEKVLEFYKSKPEDSLKYKAAIFLIENLPFRFSRKSVPGYEKAFDSINNCPLGNSRETAFRKIFKAVPKNETFDVLEITPDIQVLSSEFLIQNIELSFEAWNKIPKNKRASFEDFCQYVLPYKTANEPFEVVVRQKLSKNTLGFIKILKRVHR